MQIGKLIKENINVNNFNMVDSQKELIQLKPQKSFEWNTVNVSKRIVEIFEEHEGKQYSTKTEYINRVEMLSNYLTKNKEFYKSPLLIDSYNTTSLDKGLLIVGDYGIGKSALFKTLPKLTNNYITYNMSSELVTTYKSIKNPEDNKLFFDRYSKGRRVIDDLTSEKIISYFGTTNLIQDILEARYSTNNCYSMTICICNYDDEYPLDLEKVLDKLGAIYGARVYDRLFEMFNIIEFKGKSFRGK